MRLKRVRGAKKIPRWNSERLRNESGIKFTEDLDKLIAEESKDRNDLDVEDSWNYLKRAVIRSGEENIGCVSK